MRLEIILKNDDDDLCIFRPSVRPSVHACPKRKITQYKIEPGYLLLSLLLLRLCRARFFLTSQGPALGVLGIF